MKQRGSPERIRTAVTALRGPRARPLHYGATYSIDELLTSLMVGVPGLEPGLTEPESVGLPITPYPNAFATKQRRGNLLKRSPSLQIGGTCCHTVAGGDEPADRCGKQIRHSIPCCCGPGRLLHRPRCCDPGARSSVGQGEDVVGCVDSDRGFESSREHY